MTAWEYAQALTYGHDDYCIYAPSDFSRVGGSAVGSSAEAIEYYEIYIDNFGRYDSAGILAGSATRGWRVWRLPENEYFSYESIRVAEGELLPYTYSSLGVPAYPTPELLAYGIKNSFWAQCICVVLAVGFCLLMLSKIKIGGKRNGSTA